MLASSNGLDIAARAALIALPSPDEYPMPMSAVPASFMIIRTSAKSVLISPGVVIRSAIPCTPWSSTSSHILNAFSIEVCSSDSWSSRSFGITMSVSSLPLSHSTPFSAWIARRRPSNWNGRVTMPTVSAPTLRAISAMIGRAAGAGATALARGDEDEVGALEHLLDLVAVLLGGLLAHLGVGPRTETTGALAADVELDVGVAHEQAPARRC